MTKRELQLKMLMISFSIVLAGCFSSNPKDIQYFSKSDETVVNFSRYVLKPADEVEIHCKNVPELDLQKQRIRPDGRVSFEGIGEVEAAGKTPEELASVLKEKSMLLYTLTGENPIDVRIEVYKSAYYYVLGQVYFAGPKICTGRDTVFAAVSAARPTVLAWEQRIQVIRPSNDKKVKPKIYEINYDKMAAHGELSKDVLLAEGDIVFVPPTVLAGAGLVVEEFLSPVGRAFSTVNIVQPAPAP